MEWRQIADLPVGQERAGRQGPVHKRCMHRALAGPSLLFHLWLVQSPSDLWPLSQGAPFFVSPWQVVFVLLSVVSQYSAPR